MMTETQPDILTLELPQGLPAADLAALEQLAATGLGAAAGSGGSRATPPFIWPILALSTAPAESLRALLRTDGESFIVHETMKIRAGDAPFVQGEPMRIGVDRGGMSKNRLSVSFQDQHGLVLAELASGLRHLTRQSLGELKSISLERVARGQPLRNLTTPPLSQTIVDAFVKLVQDPNPIHTDRAQANAAGVADTVVPGAFLATMLEPALPALRPGREMKLNGISVRFMGVLETGNPVTFATAETDGPHGQPTRVFLARPDGMLIAIADLDLAA